MDKKELINKLNELLAPYLEVHDLTTINHRPHPYTIGTKHIAHASDNYRGILDERTMQSLPCAYPGCNLTYEEHTSNKVIALKLLGNYSHGRVQVVLRSTLPLTEEHGVDGFIFIENGFRVVG